MGMLIEGHWVNQAHLVKVSQGQFVRSKSKFRHWVTETGAPGPSGHGGFQAESGRYHLYVSYACPWANRVLIVRALKGLESHISYDVVHPIMLDQGWSFDQSDSQSSGDSLNNFGYLHQLYTKADPHITTRVTVPILWDKHKETIVSNESSEIIRMFNEGFRRIEPSALDLYPVPLRTEIDKVNTQIYKDINNGVYATGFATTQTAYEYAVTQLFKALDYFDEYLSSRTYLVGDQLTEADIRLAVTLFRFDTVYVQHFKTNLYQLINYTHLWRFARRIYQVPGIAETVNFDHIRQHYFKSHPSINPLGIIPIGPKIDWWAPLD